MLDVTSGPGAAVAWAGPWLLWRGSPRGTHNIMSYGVTVRRGSGPGARRVGLGVAGASLSSVCVFVFVCSWVLPSSRVSCRLSMVLSWVEIYDWVDRWVARRRARDPAARRGPSSWHQWHRHETVRDSAARRAHS